MYHKINIIPEGKTVLAEHGSLLKDALCDCHLELPCGGRGICCNCHVEIVQGDLPLSPSQKVSLERKGLSPERWRLACCTPVTGDVTIRIPMKDDVILADDAATGLTAEDGYTIAVDLGSTTIVAQLLDRRDGKVVAVRSEINSQRKFGADIISRIAYAIRDSESAQDITRCVRDQVGDMVSGLIRIYSPVSIEKVVLVGNSAMHHLFCGIDPTPLSAWPFQSDHNAACHFTGAELGWQQIPLAPVVFMPNLSHFVGSDILAGIIDLGMHESEGWNALIDLGTNGEIVIGRKGRLVCTSAAAGPAFEGVNITDGMRALSGAVSHVDEVTGKVSVIGDTVPCGICGSGLIDSIYYNLKVGRITSDGCIAEKYGDRLPVAGKVHIYAEDIREFQLAKAAISTGFDLLLSHVGLSIDDLDHIYVGGGLGNYLDLHKGVATGLLPVAPDGILKKVGNCALSGCRKLTYSQTQKAVDSVLGTVSHCSLETAPDFQDRFCNHLFF